MRRFLFLGFFTTLALVIGCTDRGDNPKVVKPSTDPTKAEEPHGQEHKKSAHGGFIVEVGRDKYHAEVVFVKGGVLRLYMLGQDETKVQEVETQALQAYGKLEGDAESVSFVIRPEPQQGDAPGMTSLFLSHLPKELAGKKIEVTIPSLKIGNDRFRVAFKSNPSGGDDHGMPAKVDDDAESKLYMTPGGKYTADDIRANGSVVASVKFKGLKATHDVKPQPCDKLCPISMTKANPKFSWVVGGKTYEFCCPPCVDEFVTLAKEKPSEIQDPEFYRKK